MPCSSNGRECGVVMLDQVYLHRLKVMKLGLVNNENAGL